MIDSLQTMPLRRALTTSISAFLLSFLVACGRDDRTVLAVLPNAHGLETGSPVTLRGFRIGHVTKLTLTDSGVLVELRIEREDAPIHATDRVGVGDMGFLGEAVVTIVPTRETAPAIGKAAVLAAAPPDSFAAEREEIMRALVREGMGVGAGLGLEKGVGADRGTRRDAPGFASRRR